MFDDIAPWYDFLNHFLSLGIDRSWRKKTVRILFDSDIPDGPLLDVCCGTGDLTAALHRRRTEVRGLDFSSEMIAIAQKKVPEVAFQVGDALNLPFDSETFAATTVAFGLRNVGDTERGLAEMVRVCKPGGTVAVLEFSMPRNFMLRGLYRFYFLTILPRIGRFFAGNRDDAYRYLPESVLAFDDPTMLARRMERLGLVDVQSFPMTFGIATLTKGRKSEP